ncbi:hypothetical protein [Streptomyces sp. NBC_00649]|uniref:hypothetical protein n=1 Tax=Streptomyces sp. NBC_00649 TaxID=2975798 RepID=UPI00386612B4
MVQRAPIREALRALDGAIEQLQGPDGGTLFDLPDATGLPAETPAPPWLMAMWGSALLACAEGSRVMPPVLPRPWRSAGAATSCPSCWWTATSPVSDARWTAAWRPPLSTPAPGRLGRARRGGAAFDSDRIGVSAARTRRAT